MSDTTNDTSAIDDKKTDNSSSNSTNYASDLVNFVKTLISLIIVVLLYFSSSGLILFVCKLAQSNILPTKNECYPYTNSKPTVDTIKTNIFTSPIISTSSTTPAMSMKIAFPYDTYNSSNKVIDMIKNYKNKSSSNFLANYFISIVEQLMSFNYSAINLIMNWLNSFPELLLVVLGPIIIWCLFVIILLINFGYTFYIWFANMGWFLKTNTNDTGDGLPKWEDVGITSPVNWALGVGFIVLFSILYLLGFGLILFVPFVILSYCCLTSLMYKGIMNNKTATSLTIIKETFKHFKVLIVSLISVGVVVLAYSKLGLIPGIPSIVILGLIYSRIWAIDLFKPIKESNLTPVVSYIQASNKCEFVKPKPEKHGFLYNFVSLFIKQGGGSITKDLKKINKNINN